MVVCTINHSIGEPDLYEIEANLVDIMNFCPTWAHTVNPCLKNKKKKLTQTKGLFGSVMVWTNCLSFEANQNY